MLAADVHAPLRVACLEVELRGRLRDLLEDPVWIELHELALDVLAGLREVLERLRVQELDAELADDPFPPAFELAQRELVEDLVPRHVVDQHVPSRVAMSFSNACSSPASPVSRTSSGSPRIAAARSASTRSSGVGSCASQTTLS